MTCKGTIRKDHRRWHRHEEVCRRNEDEGRVAVVASIKCEDARGESECRARVDAWEERHPRESRRDSCGCEGGKLGVKSLGVCLRCCGKVVCAVVRADESRADGLLTI